MGFKPSLNENCMIKNISLFLIGFVIAFFLVVQFSPVVAQIKEDEVFFSKDSKLTLKVNQILASSTVPFVDAVKISYENENTAKIVTQLREVNQNLKILIDFQAKNEK